MTHKGQELDHTHPDHKIYLQVKPALDALEKRLILQAMEESQQNQSLAARYCRISRSTLIQKLKEYRKDDDSI